MFTSPRTESPCLPASLSGHGYGVPLIGLVMTIATWGNVPATMLGSGLAARFDRFRVSLVGSLSLAIGMAGSAMFGWPVAWALVLGVLGSLHPGVIMAIGMLSARPGGGLLAAAMISLLAIPLSTCCTGRWRRVRRCWRGPDGVTTCGGWNIGLPVVLTKPRLASGPAS